MGNAILQGQTGSALGSLTTPAAAAQILNTYEAYGADGVKITGSMANKGGAFGSPAYYNVLGYNDTDNSRVRYLFSSGVGYYNTYSGLYMTYSDLAALIGLTAAKIKSPNVILGITGTG